MGARRGGRSGARHSSLIFFPWIFNSSRAGGCGCSVPVRSAPGSAGRDQVGFTPLHTHPRPPRAHASTSRGRGATASGLRGGAGAVGSPPAPWGRARSGGTGGAGGAAAEAERSRQPRRGGGAPRPPPPRCHRPSPPGTGRRRIGRRGCPGCGRGAHASARTRTRVVKGRGNSRQPPLVPPPLVCARYGPRLPPAPTRRGRAWGGLLRPGSGAVGRGPPFAPSCAPAPLRLFPTRDLKKSFVYFFFF